MSWSEGTMEELGGIAMVPLIVGLVEVAKRAGLSARLAPALAIGLGVLASLGWALAGERGEAPGPALARATLLGIVLGLSASGLYSGLKPATNPGPRLATVAARTGRERRAGAARRARAAVGVERQDETQ